MPIVDATQSALLLIDFQSRLMPAIHEAEAALRNAGRLLAAAEMLGLPVLATEQNARGLGATVAALPVRAEQVVAKQSFDACAADGFLARLPAGAGLVVAGCEAHVCVLQTVLGLRAAGRTVFVVADAVGSRHPANREAALQRMARHGAEVVTTEMVVFEWLGSAEHPRFRDAVALIK